MHWTRTLSQDSCSRNEPMHHSHLSPYFCLAHIFKQAGVIDEKNAKYRGTYAQFFLSVGFLFYLTRG